MKNLIFYKFQAAINDEYYKLFDWKYDDRNQQGSGRYHHFKDEINPPIFAEKERLMLNETYQVTLKKISSHLNKIHNFDHSTKDWEILIGPWLRISIYALYDRWYSANEIALLPDITVFSEKFTISDLVPNDFNHFHRLFYEDPWNAQIYMLYLQLLGAPIKIQGKYTKKVNKKKRDISFFLKVRNFLKRLLEPIDYLIHFIFSLICSIFGVNNKTAFAAIPSYRKLSLMFFLKGYGYPTLLRHSSIDLKSGIKKFNRLKLFAKLSNKKDISFENSVFPILLLIMPRTYLEDFKDIYMTCDSLFYVKNIDIVFSSTKHWNDDPFKIWLFKNKINSNSFKIVIWQHGGAYGTTRFTTHQEFIEKSIYDYFLTWGWRDDSKGVYPFIKPFNLDKKLNKSPNNDKKKFLIVLTRLKKYSKGDPWDSDQWNIDYINSLIKLSNHFSKFKEIDIRFRIHPTQNETGLDIKEYLLASNKKCLFDDTKDIRESISNSDLIIVTQNSTVLLQTLSGNKPTMCYWNESLNPVREDALFRFNLLRDVGIFHGDINSFISFISEKHDKIESWWKSNSTEIAKNEFCEAYASDCIDTLNSSLKYLYKKNANN